MGWLCDRLGKAGKMTEEELIASEIDGDEEENDDDDEGE